MPRLTTRSVYPVGIFLLVALVAAGLVIAVVYIASTRGEQVRRDEAQEIARQMEDEVAVEQPSVTDEATSDSSDNEQGTSANGGRGDIGEEPAEELPATGIEQSISQLIAVTLLSFSIAFYIGSRRNSTQ